MQKLKLTDYNLWFDGIIEADPDKVQDLLLYRVPLDKLSVTEESVDVLKFNKFSNIKLNVKDSINELNYDWNIPKEYMSINLDEYVNGLKSMIPKDDFFDIRIKRLNIELQFFKDKKLESFLKTIIYIIDVFKKNNIVWGVGRGSSCASYLLYLLDLHKIDPILFDIPLEEFFKE